MIDAEPRDAAAHELVGVKAIAAHTGLAEGVLREMIARGTLPVAHRHGSIIATVADLAPFKVIRGLSAIAANLGVSYYQLYGRRVSLLRHGGSLVDRQVQIMPRDLAAWADRPEIAAFLRGAPLRRRRQDSTYWR